MGDDPRHLRPRGEAIGPHDVGDIFQHRHARALAAERQRHRHDAPALAGPRLDFHGDEEIARVHERVAHGRHRLSREDLLESLRLRAAAAERGRGGVCEQDASSFPKRDDSRRHVGEQGRDALLLLEEGLGLLLQAARHRQEGAHELLELLVGRFGQAGREISPRHRAGPLDQVRHGASYSQRQTARDQRRKEKDQKAERGDRGGQLQGLGLRHAPLGQQQKREKPGAADAGYARHRLQARRDLFEPASRDDSRPRLLARPGQADGHVSSGRDAVRHEPRGEEIAARGRDESRIRGVHGQVVAHGVGEPRQQDVVQSEESSLPGHGGSFATK